MFKNMPIERKKMIKKYCFWAFFVFHLAAFWYPAFFNPTGKFAMGSIVFGLICLALVGHWAFKKPKQTQEVLDEAAS
jgi:hypothetical protein